MIKKPDGTKWKLSKLDYYMHEKIRLEKSFYDYQTSLLKTGDRLPSLTKKIIAKYEGKIGDLEQKIKIERMKKP